MDSKSKNDLSQAQRTLIVLREMQDKLSAYERRENEPLAIIGMGIKFPGDANSDEAFWKLLNDGKNAIVEIPRERWTVDDYYDPDPDAPGKSYARGGGFLKDIDLFDTQLFGITPREAVSMDPQQRLLLEVSWAALEHAGQAPTKLNRTRTGVFIGITNTDYLRLLLKNRENIDAYYALGNLASAAAGRISYVYGLQGPSIGIDTACSSSLVAIDLACQSLRTQKTDMALAGGVNLILSPELDINFSKSRMLSKDNQCKTFDADANGYVRGEGCGIIIIKRLSDAVADKDNILALIRGCAVNQDGRSSGLTAPNGPAQTMVIQQALANAKIDASQIDYVEAHGTGTALGDPIEVHAMQAALGKGRGQDRPLVIGSVKTNIGHLEPASGVAGLIKVVLSLQHEEIPAHLNFKKLNPNITLTDQFEIKIPTRKMPWPKGEKKRYAGVSSFGFSGTNAHLIVEEAPEVEKEIADVERPEHILCLSAKSADALDALALKYVRHLSTRRSDAIGDICFTANTGRSHFNHRLSVRADGIEQMRERLASYAKGQATTGVATSQKKSADEPGIVFVFTGQGAQYAGMGRELYATQPTFRKAFDRCDALFRPHLKRLLTSIVYCEAGFEQESENLLRQTVFTQPAVFALEYALAQLWQSWGVQPVAVMGHSIGEYVAACVAGVFSLEDGIQLIAERARLMQSLPDSGRMASVFAGEQRVRELIAPHGRVSVAAMNGPDNVVISGEQGEIQEILAKLEAIGVPSRCLDVSHAFHSPLMDPILDEFKQFASKVAFSAPKVSLISNLTGEAVGADELNQPDWWSRHMREPVRFAQSIGALWERDLRIFLEIGPHPTLLGMAARCVQEATGVWLPSLRKGLGDWQQILDSLGALQVRGAQIDWEGFDADYPRKKLALPTYPFQRERYWFASEALGPREKKTYDVNPPDVHPLLGRRVRSPLIEEIVFSSTVSAEALPFLRHHMIFGMIVFPATAFLEMALAAAREIFGAGSHTIEDVLIEEPLMIGEEEIRILQIILSPDENGALMLRVFSTVEGEVERNAPWSQHVSGRILPGEKEKSPVSTRDDHSFTDIRERCQSEIDVDLYYQELLGRGIDYGASFRCINGMWRGENGEILGHLRLPGPLLSAPDDGIVNTALLDGCLQVSGADLITDGDEAGTDRTYHPVSLGRVRLLGSLSAGCWCRSSRQESGERGSDTISSDLEVFDEQGHRIAEIGNFTIHPAKVTSLRRADARILQQWLYDVEWQTEDIDTAELPPGQASGGVWLVFVGRNGSADPLTEGLKARGERCITVYPGKAYAAEGNDAFVVNALRREDFERLFDQAFGDDDLPFLGIVHLWSLESAFNKHTSASLEAAGALTSGSTLHLVQTIVGRKIAASSRLWLVTAGAQSIPGTTSSPQNLAQSPLWGLGRTIGSEHPELHCSLVDLDPTLDAASLNPLFDEILQTGREDQIAYRGETRYVARLVHHTSGSRAGKERLTLPAAASYRLVIAQQGVLENLQLAPMERTPPGPGEVEILVRSSGLNFRDVLNALGMYPGEAGHLGNEFVGPITAVGEGVTGLAVGDEVMGIASGSLAKHVLARAEGVARKPDNLSHQQAATIPITFLTAYYGLIHLAGMKRGDRVLIHAAAGGVGMAAVQLANWIGAEVFGTAGSPEKRDYLLSIGVAHVMNSRTLDFADEVMSATGGQGVDIVLNALAGDFIPKSLSVLAPGGRFIELGKAEIWSPTKVAQVNPNVSYAAFDLAEVSRVDPERIGEMFGQILEGFQAGRLAPLPHRIFSLEDSISAFRFMAQAKHIGKIVIAQEDAATEDVGRIRTDATYLITGGLGGLGLIVASWLAKQGAKSIVLMGRSAPSESALGVIQSLETAGVRVTVACGDVSVEEDVRSVFAAIVESGCPLRGIVHAAGIIDDGVLAKQRWERFVEVMKPKVMGSWILHRLSQELPLDFFVLFSSTSALLGASGQGNYAAANAFMDALAHLRRAGGAAALSINWGPWADAGMAHALGHTEQQRLLARGIGSIALEQGLQILELLLTEPAAQVAVMPVQWPKFFKFYREGEAPSILQQIDAEYQSRGREKPQADRSVDLKRLLLDAPESERADLLISTISSQVGKVMGVDASKALDPRMPFSELGLDSLMAVELRNALAETVGHTLHASLIYDYPNIDALSSYLVEQTLGKKANTPDFSKCDKKAEGWKDVSGKLDDLTQDDMAKLLAQSLTSLEEE